MTRETARFALEHRGRSDYGVRVAHEGQKNTQQQQRSTERRTSQNHSPAALPSSPMPAYAAATLPSTYADLRPRPGSPNRCKATESKTVSFLLFQRRQSLSQTQ